MRPVSAPLFALLLAACGAPAASPDEAACRSEARRDPAVGEALSRINVTNAMQAQDQRDAAGAAERRAFTACMRARGRAIPSSGVEPVRPLR